ncbi:uncharacterized protein LOC131932052 [Physella acuta]|uniref:uncharacterized protein LOC131932052 n=1 Tax=Physella acuta TaxID=109671 RepID=UPI0027DCB7C7|nr:uncharacterized protein LOC131932052 [Physella acuta]
MNVLRQVLLVLVAVLETAAALSAEEIAAEAKNNKNIMALQEIMTLLAKQALVQQFSMEEKIRSEAGSGLKQVKVDTEGLDSYYINHHTGRYMNAMHDHSNAMLTIGQGEGQFNFYGVEFRTRHNDYVMKQPADDKTYHKLADVVLPHVPPAVLAKRTVQEQVEEMREWFRAWKHQNPYPRDYRPYFVPHLCYMEGAWTRSSVNIDEPFFSDRHAIDAATWFDLQEKIRFTGYTGTSSAGENYAFLPTAIMNITQDGSSEYAQWNYRVLCHRLSVDVPTSYLVLQDDVSTRLAKNYNMEKLATTRAARYKIVSPDDQKFSYWSKLDSYMAEIPGQDNYGAKIHDTFFGAPLYSAKPGSTALLNVAYYHHRYKMDPKQQPLIRGFSDPNIYMAENTQEKVFPVSATMCKGDVCKTYVKRMSYALPTEIIYLTPLSNWNPYNLVYHGKDPTSIVTKNKRGGGVTEKDAYNGTNYSTYYRTPIELFAGGEIGHDPADTTVAYVGVLDPEGNVRNVSSSGFRNQLPPIEGLGILRTRYSLMPVHMESSTVWKETNALKKIIMNMYGQEKFLIEKLIKPTA